MGIGRQTSRLLLALATVVLPAALPAANAETSAYRLGAASEPDWFSDQECVAAYRPMPEEMAAMLPGTRISELQWYGSADALLLQRASTNNRPFASLNTPTNFVLGTGDLQAGFQLGPRVTLGRRLGDAFQFECTWFGQSAWEDQKAVRDLTPNDLAGAGNLFSPFSNFGNPTAVPLLDYNNYVMIEYNSSLQSLEFNMRQRVPLEPGPFSLTVLFGGRFMKINETFRYHTESLTPVNLATATDVQTAVGNDLLGAQIGALMELQVAYRTWIGLDLKGGIYNNHADQSTNASLYWPNGDQSSVHGEAGTDCTVFVGEIQLNGTYQFTPSLTAQFGYQMIWVEGIALGSENFQANPGILVSGPAALDHKGHVIYHGPHAGLVLRW
jgi:hypothetical protein